MPGINPPLVIATVVPSNPDTVTLIGRVLREANFVALSVREIAAPES
jgi:hypothetical protein